MGGVDGVGLWGLQGRPCRGHGGPLPSQSLSSRPSPGEPRSPLDLTGADCRWVHVWPGSRGRDRKPCLAWSRCPERPGGPRKERGKERGASWKGCAPAPGALAPCVPGDREGTFQGMTQETAALSFLCSTNTCRAAAPRLCPRPCPRCPGYSRGQACPCPPGPDVPEGERCLEVAKGQGITGEVMAEGPWGRAGDSFRWGLCKEGRPAPSWGRRVGPEGEGEAESGGGGGGIHPPAMA